jgi:hypothetical protein
VVARVLDMQATQLVEAVLVPVYRLMTPRTANPRALTGGRWGRRFNIANRVAASTKQELEGERHIPAAVVVDPLNVRWDYPPSSLGMKKTSEPGRSGWK